MHCNQERDMREILEELPTKLKTATKSGLEVAVGGLIICVGMPLVAYGIAEGLSQAYNYLFH